MRIAKFLKDNKHNSLYLRENRYMQMFVLGHYLFLEA